MVAPVREEEGDRQIKIYVIDVELPRWAKKLGIYGGIPAALLLGARALVRADVTLPHTFTAGETLRPDDLNANFAELADAINDADPDCPRGYSRDTAVTSYIVCDRGNDEVVKVGFGQSAFWIDRYEASLWTAPDGAGSQQSSPYPVTFPPNGKVTSTGDLLFAASRAGVSPANQVSWFQASLACLASGRRLPTNAEWQLAVTGVSDPETASSGVNGECPTDSTLVRNTGLGVQCRSLSPA